jgi:hypothetical protein
MNVELTTAEIERILSLLARTYEQDMELYRKLYETLTTRSLTNGR